MWPQPCKITASPFILGRNTAVRAKLVYPNIKKNLTSGVEPIKHRHLRRQETEEEADMVGVVKSVKISLLKSVVCKSLYT